MADSAKRLVVRYLLAKQREILNYLADFELLFQLNFLDASTSVMRDYRQLKHNLSMFEGHLALLLRTDQGW